MAVYELEMFKGNGKWGFRIHVTDATKKMYLTFIDSKERFNTEEDARKAGERYRAKLLTDEPLETPQ